MKTLYFHIENGGVVIGVDRSSLILESMHYGNNVHTMRLDMTPDGLRQLGEMLVAQAALNEPSVVFAPAELKPHKTWFATNIATFDDIPEGKEEAAKINPLKMSYSIQGAGVIIFDGDTGLHWHVDNGGKNPTPMDPANIQPSKWRAMRNLEIAQRVRQAKREPK